MRITHKDRWSPEKAGMMPFAVTMMAGFASWKSSVKALTPFLLSLHLAVIYLPAQWDQLVLYRDAGHFANLYKVGNRGFQQASLDALWFLIWEESEGALHDGCVNGAGCFSQEHTCWSTPAGCLASVRWPGADGLFLNMELLQIWDL